MKTFNEVTGFPGLYLWGLNAQSKQPHNCFLAMFIQGQPASLTLTDALLLINRTCLCVSDSATYWGGWQDLTNYLRSKSNNLLLFQNPDAETFLWLKPTTKEWLFDHRVRFQFKGGLTTYVLPSGSGLGFKPSDSNANILFDRPPLSEIGAATATGHAKLDLSGDDIMLELPIRLDSTCFGLGKDGEERTICPTICYSTAVASWMVNYVSTPIFTQRTDTAPAPPIVFGQATVRINPLRLLYDSKASDYSRVQIHTLAALRSTFCSPTGLPLYLEGLGVQNADLVFAKWPGYSDQISLNLKGFLRPTVPGSHRGNIAPAVALGAQATEYIYLSAPGSPFADVVEFVAGQPAHFESDPVTKLWSLNDNFTTSWLSFTQQPAALSFALHKDAKQAMISAAPTQMKYVRQPECAPLMAPDGSDRKFRFKERDVSIASTAIPVLPRGSLTDAELSLANRMERLGIAPARRNALPPPAAYLGLNTPYQTRTPHGVLVDMIGDQWQRVTLAIGDYALTIDRPDMKKPWLLQDALEHPEVFLVIPPLNDATLKGLGKMAPSLGLSGWEFMFGLDNQKFAGGVNTPFMILKLSAISTDPKSADLSLVQLASDTRTWTLAERLYPGDVPAVQAALMDVIGALKKGGSLQYSEVQSRISDGHWNGLLCLNLTMGQFPSGAAGLRAGFHNGGSALMARYLCVDQTPVQANGATLVPGASSACALIDYQANNVPGLIAAQGSEAENSDRHSMVVRDLHLLIVDSRVIRFDCLLDFGLSSLFGGGFAGGNNAVLTLVGKYESVMVGAMRQERYSFETDKSTTLQFITTFPPMSSIEIRHAVLTSVAQPTKAGQDITTTLNLTGKIKMNSIGSGLLTLNSLDFSDAGMELRFHLEAGRWSQLWIGFAPGAMRFGVTSNLGGSLSKWPLALRGLLWSGRSRLKDVAGGPFFSRFGFFPILGPDIDLDFGLDFDLDLGSLGALTGLDSKLQASLAVGWCWPVTANIFGFGFKFRGMDGKLDIGIQHVIRLLADNVVMKTAPSADVDITLELKRARVEILGREIPSSGNVDLVAFVPAKSTSVAWLVSTKNALGDVAGLTIDSLAVGQRVKLTGAEPHSTRDLVQRWSNIQSDPDHPFAQVAFAKDGGWVLALGTKLGSLANVDLAMSDTPALYGVRVELPALQFSIDVLYRRVSESVGVYSTEIDLPIRSLDFGAMAITLPVIGLDIFTNGDWRFDAGMPRDHDYSRSANMQLGPFIGFGGFYIGERSGETLQFRPTNVSWWVEGEDVYTPALEFGSAGRFGLGREMTKGPLRAGISLTVYGVLHGVYGTHQALVAPDHCPPDYKKHWRLQGTLGIMFEAYGYVDLGIVKASLVVRAWAESGLTLEPHAPIDLYLEFGVSVDLEIVVARIDVPFDGSWDLKVALHWSDRLYFPYHLGTLNVLAAPPAPIDFKPYALAKSVAPLPLMLGTAPLWTDKGAALRVNLVVPLTALKAQNGQLKPVQGGRDAASILDLGSALLQWVLKDAPSSEAQLQWIDSQLHGASPAWQEVTDFLDSISLTFALIGAREHVVGTVPPSTNPSATDTIDGVLCPWLPGLGIDAVERDELYNSLQQAVLRSITDVHQVDQAYLDAVAAHYEKAFERILLPAPKKSLPFNALATSDATERLFTEWLMTVLRVIVASATTWLRDQTGHQASWSLLDAYLRSTPAGAGASPIELAFQSAGRMLFSGMRLPPPPPTNDNLSYAELAGLVLTPAPATMADYHVEPNWDTTQGAGRFIQCAPDKWWWPRVEKKLLDELATLAQDDIVEDGAITATIKDALSKTPLMQALGRPQRLQDGLAGASFHALPAPLMERALENASACVFARKPGNATTDRTTGRLYAPFYWALKIDVILRRGEGQVFEVVGIDLATRARLAALLNPVISTSRPRALDRLPLQVTVLGAGVADPKDDKNDYPLRTIWTPGVGGFDLSALCTNLSPETFPPQSVSVLSAQQFDPLARLSLASEAFLRVLYRQALTNDRHFFIGELGTHQVLSGLFAGGTGQARLSLIAALTGAPPSTHDYPLPMPDYTNGVLLASADGAQRMIEFAVDDHVYEVAPNGIPGVAAVSVKRSLGAMPGGDAQAWRQAQQYHLLDYAVTGDIKVDRESVFPIFPTTEGDTVQLGDGWLYDIGLPYVNYIKPNNPSRYEGIGKQFTFQFGLRDGMGTLFPPLANCTLPYSVCYRDLLVRLQDLGVGLNFAPAGKDIILFLQFHERSAADYPGARKILEELWRQYGIAIDQLVQPDVEASLVVTGMQSRAANEDVKTAILAALKAYQIQLRDFIDRKVNGIPATSTSIPVIADPLPKTSFTVPLLPLTVSLQIRRTGPVDAKALLLDARVQSYRAGSLPGYLAAAVGATAVTGLNTEADWTRFQTNLRAAGIDFPVARLLDRAPVQGQVSAGVTVAWLVNPAVCRIARDLRAEPVHSAPLPLFQEPKSGVDGAGQLRQFDADATLADVAALTEMFLAPKAIDGALHDDQRMDLYRDVMRYKEWIAKAFSGRVQSITSSGDAPSADATARWYAEIASDLGAAYAISTVADVRFAPMAGAAQSWSAYRMAGHAGLAETPRTDELDLGMVKMPLPASPADRPCCTLVHRPRADANGDAAGDVRLRFDFIEEELQPQQGGEPRTSRWFKLVNPVIIADAPILLPRIPRRLPRSPVIAHHEVTTEPRHAYEFHRWSYAFTVRSFETGAQASVVPMPLAFNGSRVSAHFVDNEAGLLNALAAATANLSSWRDSMTGGMSLPAMQNFAEVLGNIAQGVVNLPVTPVQSAAAGALPPPVESPAEPDPDGKFVDYRYEYQDLPVARIQAVFPRAVVRFNSQPTINPRFVMRSAEVGAARECSPNYALVVRSLSDLQTQPTVQDAETMLTRLLGQLCQGLDGQGSLELELYVRLASKFNFSAGVDEQRSPSAEQGWTTYPVGIFQRTLIDVNGIAPLVGQLWTAILGELQRLPVAARTAHILVFGLSLTSPPGPPPFDQPRNIVRIENAFARWTSPP